MTKHTRRIPPDNQGFTIIELLIATLVFSTILLLVTYGVIRISRLYYRGVITSRTQQTARSVIDEISQTIQFSGVTPSETPAPNTGIDQAFCLNGKRYSYRLGRQLRDSLGNHVLVVDTPPCSASPAPSSQDLGGASLTADSKELLGPFMRLSKLSVTNAGADLWKVTVKVTYGDDDLLTDSTDPDTVCNLAVKGSEFCATSELTTTVQRRLN